MENEKSQNENAQNFVEIIVNDDPYQIHRGRRTVGEIKTAGNVPLADKL